MGEKDKQLLKLANASGFLFQLRVEDEIIRTKRGHQSTILAREHKWVDRENEQEGFIDLVITFRTNGKMVIECKRVLDAEWLFLVPRDKEEVKRVRILWTMREDKKQLTAWDKFNLNPKSLESAFCIVRGQGEKDQPMLERISTILLRSVECLAEEELNYSGASGIPGVQFYFPVIITSAKLRVCYYDPENIDLSSGILSEAEFIDVPFIRFTKSAVTRIPTSKPPSNLEQSAQENERSVLIIDVNHLSSVLSNKWEFDLPGLHSGGKWPWDFPVWRK